MAEGSVLIFFSSASFSFLFFVVRGRRGGKERFSRVSFDVEMGKGEERLDTNYPIS